MSLINDALKKAQNRHGEPTPPASGAAGPAAIPSAPRKGKTPFAKLVVIGVVLTLCVTLLSVSLTWFILRDDSLPRAASSGNPAAQTTPPPASVATNQPNPIQPTLAPSLPPAGETPAPIPPVVAPATPPDPAPVAVTPPPDAAPTIKLGTRVQSFIDRLRVTSIRISDTGNKAILNDRLFRVNDLVEPTLGLRLTAIEPSVLTFTDENGATYLRHF